MINRKRNQYLWIGRLGVLVLCLAVGSSSGCASFRKKFVRQKKKGDEESQKFIPILEPVEYPVKTYSPMERYKQHYSLWKIWSRDLVLAIDEGRSEKQQKYLIDQELTQLTEMQKYLIPDKQNELGLLIEELAGVRQIYEKPEVMRNRISVKGRVERNAKAIRHGFAPNPSLLAEE